MNKLIKLIVLMTSLCYYQWIFANHYTYYPKNSIKQLFNQAIAEKAFPGGCIVAGTAHQIFISNCYGYYTYDKKKPDTVDSLFDVASLTKVIATTSAVMKLYEEGKINLNDKVINYLPEFKGTDLLKATERSKVSILDLLAHCSGLPQVDEINNWKDVYNVQLLFYPGRYEIYTGINFLLLQKIVEKITGMSLAQYTHDVIFKPLEMNNTFFKPDKQFLSRTIPTKFNFIKNEYLTGEVNDPTAENLGGIAGNAGLFSDARDLTIFAQMMLNNGMYQGKRIFKPSTIHLFTRRASIVSNSTRALGWDTVFVPVSKTASSKPPSQFTAGLYINSDAYGHTGYTGVSLWISPQKGIFVLLLTNRVLPYICNAKLTNPNPAIEEYWRQRINSAVWENLGFSEKNILEEIPKPSGTNIFSECL